MSATGRNVNSDSLLERIVAAPELYQCFVMIIDDGVHPRKVVNLHNLSHFAARMGQAASHLDGRFFAFQGDLDLFIGSNNIQTVEVPPLLLEPLKGAVRVPKIANINAAIKQMQANNEPGIAPLAEEAVGTEMVSTRMAMMVPHRYVNLVLEKNRTPVEFWTDIIGKILEDGKQEECKVLIDWGRVVLMNDGNGDCPVSFNDLKVPLMDKELARYRQKQLIFILPVIERIRQGMCVLQV